MSNRDDAHALCGLLADILGIESISPDQDLIDLGIDSYAAVQLFELLNERFETKLPNTTLFEHPTINSLLQHLAERAGTPE